MADTALVSTAGGADASAVEEESFAVRVFAAVATWHPVYVGAEFLFLSYKWIVFLVQVYLFFALGPHAEDEGPLRGIAGG